SQWARIAGLLETTSRLRSQAAQDALHRTQSALRPAQASLPLQAALRPAQSALPSKRILPRHLAQYRSIVQTDVLRMQELEVPLFAGGRVPVHRIRIMFAKKTDVVGIFQLIDAIWITSKL